MFFVVVWFVKESGEILFVCIHRWLMSVTPKQKIEFADEKSQRLNSTPDRVLPNGAPKGPL